jgi:hypothetical protein
VKVPSKFDTRYEKTTRPISPNAPNDLKAEDISKFYKSAYHSAIKLQKIQTERQECCLEGTSVSAYIPKKPRTMTPQKTEALSNGSTLSRTEIQRHSNVKSTTPKARVRNGEQHYAQTPTIKPVSSSPTGASLFRSNSIDAIFLNTKEASE